MTTAAPAAGLEAVASALDALALPQSVVQAVLTLVQSALPSRVRARDEAPSGHDISFERGRWIRLQPRLEDHPDAEVLEDVMAKVRPDLPRQRRSEVLRDFVRFNVERARRSGHEAKARKLGEFIGFAAKWQDRLGAWLSEEKRHRVVRKASEAPITSVAPKAPAPVIPDRDLRDRIGRNRASLEAELIRAVGDAAYRSRVDQVVAAGAPNRWEAITRVLLAAIKAREISG